MSLPVPTEHYLVLASVLFCIGALGATTRRNPIVVFMCIELMLNASNLGFIAIGRHYGHANGQLYALFVMAVAAAEVAIGLAIIVTLFRTRETVDIDGADLLKL